MVLIRGGLQCEQAIFAVDRLTGLKGLGKGFNIDFKFIVRHGVSLPVWYRLGKRHRKMNTPVDREMPGDRRNQDDFWAKRQEIKSQKSNGFRMTGESQRCPIFQLSLLFKYSISLISHSLLASGVLTIISSPTHRPRHALTTGAFIDT